jgi:hypothetical protein
MPNKQKDSIPNETRWAIAPDWFPANHRSMEFLLKDYLCAKCAGKLSDKKEPASKALLASIQNCCSKSPDFIHEKLPILESAFRLFLTNGNTPMTLKEISTELAKVRYGDVYRTSPETLLRILKSDNYYGLQENNS